MNAWLPLLVTERWSPTLVAPVEKTQDRRGNGSQVSEIVWSAPDRPPPCLHPCKVDVGRASLSITNRIVLAIPASVHPLRCVLVFQDLWPPEGRTNPTGKGTESENRKEEKGSPPRRERRYFRYLLCTGIHSRSASSLVKGGSREGRREGEGKGSDLIA